MTSRNWKTVVIATALTSAAFAPTSAYAAVPTYSGQGTVAEQTITPAPVWGIGFSIDGKSGAELSTPIGLGVLGLALIGLWAGGRRLITKERNA